MQLENADAVLNLRPDARMAEFDKRVGSLGIIAFDAYMTGTRPPRSKSELSRPALGVKEDPVFGSGNGSVAAFIRDSDQIGQFGASYAATQGSVVGRAGKLFVTFEGQDIIRVGGQSVTCKGLVRV